MRGKKLTIAEMNARAEALEECAGHMEQNWTDCAREREAGCVLASRLLSEAEAWRARVAREKARLP